MKPILLASLALLLTLGVACGQQTPNPAPSPTPVAGTLVPTVTLTLTSPAPAATATATRAASAPTVVTPSARSTTIIADIPIFQGMILLMHVSGGIAGFCDDLALFESSQIIYGPCGAAVAGTLSAEQLVQIKEWQNRYRSFEFTFQDNPRGPDNMTTTLLFNGKGPAEPTETEKEQIMAWARQLYAELSRRRQSTPGAAAPQTLAVPTLQPTAPANATSTASASSTAPTAAPPQAGLSVLQGPGFSLGYPANATIEQESPTKWRLLGPSIAVRPGEGGAEWSGPAYALDFELHDNPQGAGSAAWARAYLVAAWQTASQKQALFVGPVDGGKVVESKVAEVRMGDKAAFQTDWFGGDRTRRVVYLSLKTKTLSLSYDLYPIENYPLAEAAADIYGLLLSRISAPEAEGAPRAMPPAQGLREFTGPGFFLAWPEHAVLAESDANHWEVVGPEINIAPATGDGSWEGPAYRLDLILHDNGEKLEAARWAERELLAAWQKAKAANEPFTGPVDVQGKLRADGTATLQVGGLPAFQADWFFGDRTHRVVYLNAANQILAVHSDLLPVASYSAAPFVEAAYALLLNGLSAAR